MESHQQRKYTQHLSFLEEFGRRVREKGFEAEIFIGENGFHYKLRRGSEEYEGEEPENFGHLMHELLQNTN